VVEPKEKTVRERKSRYRVRGERVKEKGVTVVVVKNGSENGNPNRRITVSRKR